MVTHKISPMKKIKIKMHIEKNLSRGLGGPQITPQICLKNIKHIFAHKLFNT